MLKLRWIWSRARSWLHNYGIPKRKLCLSFISINRLFKRSNFYIHLFLGKAVLSIKRINRLLELTTLKIMIHEASFWRNLRTQNHRVTAFCRRIISFRNDINRHLLVSIFYSLHLRFLNIFLVFHNLIGSELSRWHWGIGLAVA
jgi:hypothetical protein